MAKQNDGYIGGFSGRLGTAIGYMWNGRWCVRSRPAKVSNPRTERQQTQRALFAREVQLASRMRWVLGTTMTEQARSLGMTAYNLFVKSNQHCFSSDGNGGLRVDYERLQLSQGVVGGVAATDMGCRGGVLEVGFTTPKGTPRAARFDSVFLYAFSPELEEGYLAAPVYRKAESVKVLLPDGLAATDLHVYIMAQDAQGRWSGTAYCGLLPAGGEPTAAGTTAGEPALPSPVAAPQPQAAPAAPADNYTPDTAAKPLPGRAKAPDPAQLSLF